MTRECFDRQDQTLARFTYIYTVSDERNDEVASFFCICGSFAKLIYFVSVAPSVSAKYGALGEGKSHSAAGFGADNLTPTCSIHRRRVLFESAWCRILTNMCECNGTPFIALDSMLCALFSSTTQVTNNRLALIDEGRAAWVQIVNTINSLLRVPIINKLFEFVPK